MSERGSVCLSSYLYFNILEFGDGAHFILNTRQNMACRYL